MRIAIGGIRHESNTFSTLTTSLDDFTIERGDAILANPAFAAPASDVKLVPVLSARAAPHGVVERAAYEALRDEFAERLASAGRIDGLLLDLHGAMEVAEIGDGETDLIATAREIVGPDVPIAASLDLHANLNPDAVAECVLMTAYRTAPHRDGVETRWRALEKFIAIVRDGRRTVTAMVKPPMLIPGENAVTDMEPARGLYELLPAIERRPGLIDASVIIGCAWTDSPFTSTAALVVGEAVAANAAARELAEIIWAKRAEFGPEVETVPLAEAIECAARFASGPVFISDSGDNVTAGGAGDLTIALKGLIEAGVAGALVGGIADPASATAAAKAGVGTRVTLDIGGRLDRVNGRPLRCECVVARLSPAGALVSTGGVDVILAVDRRPFVAPAGFADYGIDPTAYRIVVVKQGYLFPDLRAIARGSIMATTPGFTDLDLHRLPFRRVRRPIYPLDGRMTWSASG